MLHELLALQNMDPHKEAAAPLTGGRSGNRRLRQGDGAGGGGGGKEGWGWGWTARAAPSVAGLVQLVVSAPPPLPPWYSDVV
jgi:hypothetical protein